VRKSSSLASAYARTPDTSFWAKPFDDALAAVYRILLRVSRHARGHGAAPEDVFRKTVIHLDVVGAYPRFLAFEKYPYLPVLITRSLTTCQNRFARLKTSVHRLPGKRSLSVTLSVSRGSQRVYIAASRPPRERERGEGG
jgi:hypothetical protein